MLLRKVTIENIPILQKIGREAYTHYFKDHWQENGLDLYLEDQFGAKKLQTELNDHNFRWYFISFDHDIAGFIKLNLEARLDGIDENCCELEKIYLLPAWKAKGLGKLALEELIDELILLNKKYLYLCVVDSNTDAMRFYERLNFEYHSKTQLEAPLFREELKGMHRMYLNLTTV